MLLFMDLDFVFFRFRQGLLLLNLYCLSVQYFLSINFGVVESLQGHSCQSSHLAALLTSPVDCDRYGAFVMSQFFF